MFGFHQTWSPYEGCCLHSTWWWCDIPCQRAGEQWPSFPTAIGGFPKGLSVQTQQTFGTHGAPSHCRPCSQRAPCYKTFVFKVCPWSSWIYLLSNCYRFYYYPKLVTWSIQILRDPGKSDASPLLRYLRTAKVVEQEPWYLLRASKALRDWIDTWIESIPTFDYVFRCWCFPPPCFFVLFCVMFAILRTWMTTRAGQTPSCQFGCMSGTLVPLEFSQIQRGAST